MLTVWGAGKVKLAATERMVWMVGGDVSHVFQEEGAGSSAPYHSGEQGVRMPCALRFTVA